MDRMTILWTLTLFFGSSLLFRTLNRATEDSPLAVQVGVQLAALALLIGAIVLFVRSRRPRD